jgi:hypothetical protein
MENLFTRFKVLSFKIQSLGVIVQNPILIERVEFDKWKVEQATPLLIDLNNLINEVEGYYFNMDLCPWCNEYHTGGPENCAR